MITALILLAVYVVGLFVAAVLAYAFLPPKFREDGLYLVIGGFWPIIVPGSLVIVLVVQPFDRLVRRVGEALARQAS